MRGSPTDMRLAANGRRIRVDLPSARLICGAISVRPARDSLCGGVDLGRVAGRLLRAAPVSAATAVAATGSPRAWGARAPIMARASARLSTRLPLAVQYVLMA